MKKQNAEKLIAPIITMMEKGVVPWVKTWKNKSSILYFNHRNFKSGRLYHGQNQFLLTAIAQDKGYDSNGWLTFPEIQELGGRIKKGEKGTMVVYGSKFIPKSIKSDSRLSDEEKEDKSIFFLKTRYNWNVAQLTGIDYKSILDSDDDKLDFEPVEEAEKHIPKDCKIKYGLYNPAYIPSKDEIIMPNKNDFKTLEDFYSALFHEVSHWTGHESRLNREGIKGGHFGDKIYSKEELIAEMSSSFILSYLGIRSEALLTNTAGYLQSWLKVIKDDPSILMKAATQAMKAYEFICGETE